MTQDSEAPRTLATITDSEGNPIGLAGHAPPP